MCVCACPNSTARTPLLHSPTPTGRYVHRMLYQWFKNRNLTRRKLWELLLCYSTENLSSFWSILLSQGVACHAAHLLSLGFCSTSPALEVTAVTAGSTSCPGKARGERRDWHCWQHEGFCLARGCCRMPYPHFVFLCIHLVQEKLPWNHWSPSTDTFIQAPQQN